MSFIHDMMRVHRVLCIQSTCIVYTISYICGLMSHTAQCLRTPCIITFTRMRRRVLRSHDGVCLCGYSCEQQNFVIHIHTCYLTNTRYFGITCSGITLYMLCYGYLDGGSAGFLDLLMMKSKAAVAMSFAACCASD